ncbi:hypothetical protein DPMN_083326 [Dreissena polymorpha]|uniref:Uncharacterized protein n=1 Tax=Dreissena polymorpha TaxID=45954 RepID=A0A9D3Y8N3_DREPO|nr:hypothetical protein DPMN_083326 [Dreissena polymorpha]
MVSECGHIKRSADSHRECRMLAQSGHIKRSADSHRECFFSHNVDTSNPQLTHIDDVVCSHNVD